MAPTTRVSVRGSYLWDAPDLVGDQANSEVAGGETEHDAHSDQAQAGARHHPQHVGACSAERHPDTDLVRLLRNCVSDDAEDAHRDEHEPHRREDPDDDEAEARLGVRELLQVVGQRTGQGQRHTAIDAPHLFAHAVEERSGLSFGPHQDAPLECARDAVRNEDFRSDRILDPVVLCVGHHADDLEERVLHGRVRQRFEVFEPDVLADRIFRAEILVHEGLIDDRDAACGIHLDVGQESSANEAEAERRHVALAAQLVDRVPALGRRLAGNLDLRSNSPIRRQRRGRCRSDDAGQRLQPRQQRLEESLLVGRRVVLAARERQPGDENVVGVQPEIHALHDDEAAHQQPGRGEQRQRQRDLGDDQAVAKPVAAESSAHALARILQ